MADSKTGAGTADTTTTADTAADVGDIVETTGDDGGAPHAGSAPDPWDAVLTDAEKEYDAALKAFDPAPSGTPQGGSSSQSAFDRDAFAAELEQRILARFGGVGGQRGGARDERPAPAPVASYPDQLPNPSDDPEGYHRGMLAYQNALLSQQRAELEARFEKMVNDRFTTSQATLTDYAISQHAQKAMAEHKYASPAEVEHELRSFYPRAGRLPNEADVRRIVAESHRRVERVIAEDRKQQIAALRERAARLRGGPQPGGTNGRVVAFQQRLANPKTAPKTREERAAFVADALNAGLGEGEF